MRKNILLMMVINIISLTAYSQADYRTTEDGLSQLMNNGRFIDKLKVMSRDQVAGTTLDKLLHEFVPEYKTFQSSGKPLNLDKIYAADPALANNTDLAGKIGQLMGIKETEMASLKALFNGTYKNTGFRPLTDLFSKSMYQRGKNEGVDFIVDNTNGFLKKQFGQSDAAGQLIDVGTGLLGSLIFSFSEEEDKDILKQQAEAVAQTKKRELEQADHFSAYEKGVKLETEGWTKSNMGSYQEAIKDYDAAITSLNSSFMGGPELVATYKKRAQAKLNMNSTREAIIDYYLAIKTAEKVINKNWEPAVKVEDEITASVGKENVDVFAENELVDLYMARGYAKYVAKDFTGARADAEKALALYSKIDAKAADWQRYPNTFNPDDFTPQLHPANNLVGLLAMIDFAENKQEEALRKFDYTITRITMANSMVSMGGLPVSFTRELMLVKAYAYYKNGQVDKAKNLYNNIIDNKQFIIMKGGNVAPAYACRGNLFLLNKEYQQALDDYNSAIDITPTEISFYANRANCKLLLNDKEGASKDFAFVKNPATVKSAVKSEEYYQNQYIIYASTTNEAGWNSGLSVLKEGVRIYPKSAKLTGYLMYFINKLKDTNTALQFTTLYPANSLSSVSMHMLYLSLSGKESDALVSLEKAFELGLDMETAASILPSLKSLPAYCQYLTKYITNGQKMLTAQDKAMAQKNIESMLQENNPYKKLAIVMQYQLLGNIDKAYTLLEEYLQSSPYTLMPMTAELKVSLLFQRGQQKEAVAFAKSFCLAQENGTWKDNPGMVVLQNIAKNTCNY